MAPLRSIMLRNYRRFTGEIEIVLEPNVNLIVIPPGMGKTTILEAISWCLLGNELVNDPGSVPNIDSLGKGMAEVRVGLTFQDGKRLERYALFHSIGSEVSQEGWGWRLVDPNKEVVIAEGNEQEGFQDWQEKLFPETCVHANLISGASLGQVLQGCRGGVERAVESSNVWCCSDLPLRCSMEATGLHLRICPDSQVNVISYDATGRLEVTSNGPISREELQMVLLSHALTFAYEHSPGCPIFLDEPFVDIGSDNKPGLLREILDLASDRQVVFLLASDEDITLLRATGKVERELEIWG